MSTKPKTTTDEIIALLDQLPPLTRLAMYYLIATGQTHILIGGEPCTK